MTLYNKHLNLQTIVIAFSFLILTSCTQGPPKEEGEFNESDLVELITLDPTFKLDIRYATDNNLV